MLKLAIYVCIPLLFGIACFIMAIGKKWRTPLVKRFPLVAIYSVVTAFFSPNLTIYIFLCSLIVPIFSRKREDIVPIYIFALLLLPGVGLTTGIGSMMLLPITGFTTLGLGAALWAKVKGRAGYSRSHLSAICIGALFFMMVFAGARGTSFTNLIRVLVDISLALLLPYYITRRCIKTPQDVRLVTISLIAVTAGLSALAIYEAKTSWPLYRLVFDHYGITLISGASVKLRGGLLRSPGPFDEPTSFALWLALGAGALLSAGWLFKSKPKHGFLVLLFVAGLFGPQSRGAWLGLISFYAVYQMANGRSTSIMKPLVITVGAALSLYCTALFVPSIANMLGLNSVGGVNRDYRQDLFSRGLEEAKHNIFIGTDIGSVTYALRDLVQGEGIVDFVNSYLTTLLLTGLVGLSMFMFAIFAPISALFNYRSRVRGDERHSTSFVIATLTSISIMIIFTSLGGRTITGICILIGLSGSLLNAKVIVRQRNDLLGKQRTSRKMQGINIDSNQVHSTKINVGR